MMRYSLEAFPLGIPGYSAGILRMASRYYYDDASLLMLWSAWGVTSQMNHERNAFKKTHFIPTIFLKPHKCNIVHFLISQNDNFWLKIRQYHIKKGTNKSLSESFQRPVRGTGGHKCDINKAENTKDGQSSNKVGWK